MKQDKPPTERNGNMSKQPNGWIGVDLDGTLAFYDNWKGCDHIGDPVPKMADRVKKWSAEGKEVRIFTARVSPQACALNGISLQEAEGPIYGWLRKHFGRVFKITHEKDMAMVQLWDDRCVQVIPNTGERADGKE